ncbi:long-chain fatty acid--CoA ligase [Sphingomonas sp. Leaf407]|uniref:long-chain fatty acid--CoA ligase n=1 Tax=unclassified Sphingomonas TaxID=196159 RepID=UPI0006FD0C03|nr:MULTISPECIES: long-chain fatty acid--CoA ligase [unclassified Sphingomonas]KQN37656.1 long-chain fatty acid--CoA ligase [Sphingomonas sp. Leaf42]KQT28023.1 long-chain fatty acid--CoA ligase [Sphingomonas sp. Leaf407]
MLGGMQDFELRVPRLLDHAEREHGAREIVTRWADGSESRTDWAGIARDARRLAQALAAMGIRPGDRVATLAMNHAHHLVAWYGVIGMGGLIHTINPRLFDDQLAYIATHAGDRVLLHDRAFAPIVERMRSRWPTIERYVVMDGDGPDSLRALIEAQDGDYAWVEGSEREPCMVCYTSGTTGDPKGVVYSHRSNVLHAIAELQPAEFDLSSRSVCLPVVPMFHAVGWGLPFAAPAVGAKLVLSAVNDAGVLCELMNRERVTHSAGVPTVWFAMFEHIDRTGTRPEHLKIVTIGGSAAPRAMIERIMGMGVRVNHAWGMTETSPIGTMGAPSLDWDDLSFEARVDQVCRQGKVPFGVELRTVDDADRLLPRDGVTSGRLQVRGPWVIKRYFLDESGDALTADGWFDTGDVAVMHPDGTMQITDRDKDVIKSGGEWISSVELENAAVGCAGVAEAAAIGVPHPRWDERPILLIVRQAGSAVDEATIHAHLAGRVAKWWLPDAILFVEQLPHSATGKLRKNELRAQYRDYPI